MSRSSTATTPAPDRLGYVWLALAAALFAVAAGRWSVPVAAWLAPLFLLRYLRTRRALPGLLLAWLVRYAIAAAVTLPGTVLLSGPRYAFSVLLIISVAMLPYVADRLLAARVGGFAGTLVFPTAFTTLEYLTAFGPTGTNNSVANGQYGELPLIQVAAVTGIWGITFLMTWFAAVGNWVWEQGFTWPRVRTGALAYAAVLAAVLLGGGLRLAVAGPEPGTVRVAGISASRQAAAAAASRLTGDVLDALESGRATPVQESAARDAFAVLDADLLDRTRVEAQAGARIVAWPEASPVGASVLAADRRAFLQRAAALARQQGIYLDMGLGVFLPGTARPPYLEDEAVLVDPAGHVAWTYEKSHLVPFTETGLVVLGTGKPPLTDTPYGRLATVICFDQDFPSLMRRLGERRADLVLGPSDDWRGIDPSHAHAAVLRAVENGYSLLRPASQGLSLVVDGEGRVLGASDWFSTDRQSVVADVPTRGVRTVYSRIGDTFARLCAAGLVALTVAALRRPRRRV